MALTLAIGYCSATDELLMLVRMGGDLAKAAERQC